MTTMNWTIWTNAARPGATSEKQDYGLRDEKGRAVGGFATVAQHWNGVCFELLVFATRNGKPYGASPRGTMYETMEEAQAAAPAKLAEQKKRYGRKYGKVSAAPKKCTYMTHAVGAAREAGCPLTHCYCGTHDHENVEHTCKVNEVDPAVAAAERAAGWDPNP